VAVAAHPLYERLLEAHVACLCVDHLPRIDAQISARSPPLVAAAAAGPSGDEELDLFMALTPLPLFCSALTSLLWVDCVAGEVAA